jgi:ankyrin repeat protein
MDRWIDEELIGAAHENNLPEVRRLLRAGADVNGKDQYDRTSLHQASLRGHVQVKFSTSCWSTERTLK